jgi:hypothetical protein
MKKVIAETKLSGFAIDVEICYIAESLEFSHASIPRQVNLPSQFNINLCQSLTATMHLFKIRNRLKGGYGN